MAERERFELSVRDYRTHDFQPQHFSSEQSTEALGSLKVGSAVDR